MFATMHRPLWTATTIVGGFRPRWWRDDYRAAGHVVSQCWIGDRNPTCYPSSVAISAAGLTCSNAHRLAAALAFEIVCRAWNAVYQAEGIKPTNVSGIRTFRRPLVKMCLSDERGFPLFRGKHITAVVDAIQIFPDFDAGDIQGRSDWERARVKERRASAKPPAAKSEQGEGNEGGAGPGRPAPKG